MKKNRKKIRSAIAAMFILMSMTACAETANDKNKPDDYQFDPVIVEGEVIRDKFGNVVTEQSYYRTGGDVNVITREEIEKRHYIQITDAIRRVPGVTIRSPGYRGNEYGGSYNNTISINGDTRVIVLIDGRRIDNTVSEKLGANSTGAAGKATIANLDEHINMENVEKIEVIKGPGASVYGADATGGVINIITRKGGTKNIGTIDLSTGSWGKHNYALSYSGSTGSDNSWRYFVSGNRSMSGDTEYKSFGRTGTLIGSDLREDGANIRIDKDFDEKRSLKIWFNYKDGKAGWPIAAKNLRYYTPEGWRETMFYAAVGYFNPDGTFNTTKIQNALPVEGRPTNYGYSNAFLEGSYGSYSTFKNIDWDVVYTFNKENGMDSFIRYYHQNHSYTRANRYTWGYNWNTGANSSNLTNAFRDFANTFPGGVVPAAEWEAWADKWLAPFPDNKAAMREWVRLTGGYAVPSTFRNETNHGIQLQYAKAVGIHDIIASVTYDKAKLETMRNDSGTAGLVQSSTTRDTIRGYVQDKIHVTDKWEITPAVRFSRYHATRYTTYNTAGEVATEREYERANVKSWTPVLNTQYMIDDSSSVYLGWTRIYRPMRRADYDTVDTVFRTPLQDEKGNVWTMGVRKDFSAKTSAGVNYSLTDMSNAIASLPVIVWDEAAGEYNRSNTAINAKQTMKAFNINANHKFNENLTLSASYAHKINDWKAKPGWVLDPEWGYRNSSDINTMINRLTPKNHYVLDLAYEKGKVYTGLMANWYTGCDLAAFSSKRFMILDWSANYKVTKDTTAYLAVTNLTNAAYETMYNANWGPGGFAMPGRNFMVGVKHKF